ncbi:MAG: alpha/beta fold hydrolase [SAR324 cluster bacterium]|nr:alpha/beta fold hydrolase [SAR324 cluster bacterium]
MIHGATVPHWEFDRLVPHLHKANWQTLRMDLYGHGRSAHTERDYTISLFTEQIWEALSYLRTKTGISVLGHSLGAVIAVNLVQQHPEFFRHLVLVAPRLDFTSKQWWN